MLFFVCFSFSFCVFLFLILNCLNVWMSEWVVFNMAFYQSTDCEEGVFTWFSRVKMVNFYHTLLIFETKYFNNYHRLSKTVDIMGKYNHFCTKTKSITTKKREKNGFFHFFYLGLAPYLVFYLLCFDSVWIALIWPSRLTGR